MGRQLPATSFSNDQFPGLTNFHNTHTGSQPPPSATSLSNDQFLDPNFYNLQTGGQLPSTSFSNNQLPDTSNFCDTHTGSQPPAASFANHNFFSDAQAVTATSEELPPSFVNDQFHHPTTFSQQMGYHNVYSDSLRVRLPPPEDMNYPAMALWLAATPDMASASSHYGPPPPYLHGLSPPVLSIDGLSSMPVGFKDVPPFGFGEPLLSPKVVLPPPLRKQHETKFIAHPYQLQQN
jgi:hypothetical protein